MDTYAKHREIEKKEEVQVIYRMKQRDFVCSAPCSVGIVNGRRMKKTGFMNLVGMRAKNARSRKLTSEKRKGKILMNYQEKLVEAICEEDFFETNEILEEICKNEMGEEYVEFLINFMSDNPDIDYGVPGPVVHFIEKYPVDFYLGFLLKAIERKPNDTLLWMLNRIANVSDKKDKKKYMDVFQKTAKRKDIDAITKDTALRFYKFQKEEL